MNCTCRNCGGDLEPIGKGLGRCLFCKTINSMPTVVSEKLERAERLRREMLNFDSASVLYTQIINEAPDEADAYWGLVLCRYGIEYVTDKDGTLKATCHRTIEYRIQDDSDFKLACEKASVEQKEYFIEQAKYIDDVQRKILEIVHKEKPYDVFISYKAKDDDNNPTMDSKHAQKIYFKLTNEGYRVFFAEETLKDVIGSEYEPIIYAALKSSKTMILIGSRPEYFEATWVRNEWQRFLDMMEQGDNKTLLPVYYNMDPYMLPQKLANLQALDWQDSEAMITLLKVVENQSEQMKNNRTDSEIEKVIVQRDFNNAKLKYDNALSLFNADKMKEAILLLDELIKERPNYAEAYWLRLHARIGVKFNELPLQQIDISTDTDYIQAVQNASSQNAEEYKRIKDICMQNIKVQNEYKKSVQDITNDYKSFNPVIQEFERAGACRKQMMEMIQDEVFKIRFDFRDALMLILGVFIVVMKLPFAVMCYYASLNFAEAMRDAGVIKTLLSFLLLILLSICTYFGPLLLSFLGYLCLIVERRGLGVFVSIISGIVSFYSLLEPVVYGSLKVPGPKYAVENGGQVPIFLFYAVDIIVILIILINAIRLAMLETKLKVKRVQYKSLTKQYEELLIECGKIVEEREKNLVEEIKKKMTSEKAMLKTKNISQEYNAWMQGEKKLFGKS